MFKVCLVGLVLTLASPASARDCAWEAKKAVIGWEGNSPQWHWLETEATAACVSTGADPLETVNSFLRFGSTPQEIRQNLGLMVNQLPPDSTIRQSLEVIMREIPPSPKEVPGPSPPPSYRSGLQPPIGR